MRKTDNGPQFISEEFESYLEENYIKHKTSTPLWPQANGDIEKQNRSLLKALRIAQAERKNSKHELLKFFIAYRSTLHSTTGASPAKLLYGSEIRTKIPDLQSGFQRINADSEKRDRDSPAKQKGKDYADGKRNAQESCLGPGDQVLLRQNRKNKLDTSFEQEPYEVIGKQGSEITIQSPSGTQYRRNVTHVKKYHTESPVGTPTPEQPEERIEDQVEGGKALGTPEMPIGEVPDIPGTPTGRPRREHRTPERLKSECL